MQRAKAVPPMARRVMVTAFLCGTILLRHRSRRARQQMQKLMLIASTSSPASSHTKPAIAAGTPDQIKDCSEERQTGSRASATVHHRHSGTVDEAQEAWEREAPRVQAS